jgi:two-component system heavy metal sensor histidine kinase CusS
MGVSNSLSQQSRCVIHRLTECVDQADTAALHSLSGANDFPAELLPLAKRVEQLVSVHNQLLKSARSISIGLNHELRTPLHVLMLQTEVSLRSPRSVAEYEDLLLSNLEEFKRLGAALDATLMKLQALGRTVQEDGVGP